VFAGKAWDFQFGMELPRPFLMLSKYRRGCRLPNFAILYMESSDSIKIMKGDNT
jgi:hypothetical protein